MMLISLHKMHLITTYHYNNSRGIVVQHAVSTPTCTTSQKTKANAEQVYITVKFTKH